MTVRPIAHPLLISRPAVKIAPKAVTASSQPLAHASQKTFAAVLKRSVSGAAVPKANALVNLGQVNGTAHVLGASNVQSKLGFNALVQTTPPPAQAAAAAPSSHWYAANAVDDAYWNQQPAAVQQLREIDDPAQRQAVATQLAGQGYQIDVPVMVWGWDAGITNSLRASAGYTWVPSALQNPVSAAPGLTGPGITPYDPNNPPPGSIMVSA